MYVQDTGKKTILFSLYMCAYYYYIISNKKKQNYYNVNDKIRLHVQKCII